MLDAKPEPDILVCRAVTMISCFTGERTGIVHFLFHGDIMPRPASNAPKTNTEKSRTAATSKQVPSRTKNDEESKSSAKVVTARQLVITEDEFRGRIAAKAYDLYMRRQAITETDDWMQAERLVKEELLAEGHHAGSV